MDTTTRPLVWINGWPAVGKQTVAQCLVQILGQDRAVLIDDNEFTDHLEMPAEGGRARGNSMTKGKDGKDHSSLSDPPTLQEKQTACFAKYVEDPQSLGRIVIFTDSRADDAAGAAGARLYEAAARQAGRPFAPVYMECGLEANLRRTQTSERRCNQSSSKMCSPEALRALRARTNGRLYRFRADEWPGLCVNVTDQGAHDTAMQILAFINEVSDQHDRDKSKVAE